MNTSSNLIVWGVGTSRTIRPHWLEHVYGLAPDVNAKAAEYFLRQLRHVQVALADGRPHLMGERFSSADILLTSCLDWAVGYKLTLFDSALAYLARMQAREAYQSAKRHNVPRVAGEPVLRRG